MSRLLNAANAQDLERAAGLLASGGVVAFPTETVYGLGADATNPAAVARVFEIKNRPSFDPLIVHVASRAAAEALWSAVPAAASRLMEAFWPGPLTIVLPKNGLIPDIVTSGLPTVAVRMPANAHALALIAKAGRPVAAPSANPFGRTSPTTAEAVEEELGGAVDAILNGGPCAVGVESTVVGIEEGAAILLRPGGVPAEDIARLVPVRASQTRPGLPSSPGQMETHYAPLTPLVLLARPLADEAAAVAASLRGRRAGLLAFGPGPRSAPFAATENLSASGDLREAAANLFQAMRKLDRMKLDCIVAEPVPPTGLGAAILDRLSKASSGRGIEALAAIRQPK